MAAGFNIKDILNQKSKEGLETQTEKASAAFQTKEISIFKMYRNENNFYTKENIESLAAEIALEGLKQNLEVKHNPCEKGEYEIISGERRWLALNMLVSQGKKEFEMATTKITNPQSQAEETIEIILANSYRIKSTKDLLEEEKRLKEALQSILDTEGKIKGKKIGKTELRTEIAKIMKSSETKIAQIETINKNLIPEFKKELEEDRMNFTQAYRIAGMTSEAQREMLERYIDQGELTTAEIEAKRQEIAQKKQADQIPGQISISDQREKMSDSDNLDLEDTAEENAEVDDAEADTEEETEEEFEPQPETITSLCYSCVNYATCNQKWNTVIDCNEYINKTEVEKTREQQYAEEQEALDRESKRVLKEREEQAIMQNIPSKSEAGSRTQIMRIAPSVFKNIESRIQSFLLVKKEKEYKVNSEIELLEFKEARNTGRALNVSIKYILEDYTGLEDGYCILGIDITENN